jgi:hypothetical protein
MKNQPEKSGANEAAGESSTAENLRSAALDRSALDETLEAAVNYRGDVTVRLRGGEAIVGFAYDVVRRGGAMHALRIMLADGERRSIACSSIESVELSGRDTASGRSFESWMKKYVQTRLAGERAAIDGDQICE